MIRTLAPFPRPSVRMLLVMRRNLLVWRKLFWPTLAAFLVDPAVALFGIGLGIGSLVGEVGDVPYIVFIASGMAVYSVAVTASYESLYSAFLRMETQQTWIAILCAPMTLGDVFLGELLWSAVKATAAAVVLTSMAAAFGFLEWQAVVYVLPFVFVGALSMASVALLFNSLAKSQYFFEYYFSMYLTPMAMLSGLFFPREVLPGFLQAVSEALPMTHILLLVRPLALGRWPDDALGPLVYLTVVGAVCAYVAYQLTYRRMFK